MKIFERLIHNLLLKIHDYQYGFIPGNSTADNIQAMRLLVESSETQRNLVRIPRKGLDLDCVTTIRSHGVPERYAKIQFKCTSGASAL